MKKLKLSSFAGICVLMLFLSFFNSCISAVYSPGVNSNYALKEIRTDRSVSTLEKEHVFRIPCENFADIAYDVNNDYPAGILKTDLFKNRCRNFFLLIETEDEKISVKIDGMRLNDSVKYRYEYAVIRLQSLNPPVRKYEFPKKPETAYSYYTEPSASPREIRYTVKTRILILNEKTESAGTIETVSDAGTSVYLLNQSSFVLP